MTKYIMTIKKIKMKKVIKRGYKNLKVQPYVIKTILMLVMAKSH